MANMDVDMEIDFDVDPEVAQLQAAAEAFQVPTYPPENEAMNGVEEAVEDGEVDQNAVVPKVHIRGVNSLSTGDVGNYAREHYDADFFRKVEWVDDTSANLVYDTETAALEALQAFSADERMDVLELRPAKRLSTHPEVELFVRQATESDAKVKNSHKFSSYYLNAPDIDPENPHGNRRGKRRSDDRSTYRVRDYGYKRRRGDLEDDRYSRRGSNDEPFDVNLYDDDPVSVAARKERTNSYSSVENGRKRARFNEELLPERQSGRLRNRSASPTRDGDGRFGFQEDGPRRRTAKARSPTPPELRKTRIERNRGARDDLNKELFPEKITKSALANGHTNSSTELFPNHSSPPKTPRELFPSHKRQEARDLDSEYKRVSDSMSRYTLDGANDNRTYNQPADRKNRDSKPRGDLFSRISGGPNIDKSYGRLHDRPGATTNGGGAGFSFKGAGRGDEFSILGASKDKAESSLPKELFPMKAGGGGERRELFDGRIKGRGQRRRAEDLM